MKREQGTQSQKLMVFVLTMSLYGLATLFTELIPKFQVGIVEFSVEFFLFIPLVLAMLFDPLSAALGAATGELVFSEIMLGQFGGLGEIEKFIRPGHSVDTILSNVYQKLILRFGQPKSLDLSGAKPHVVFFIGPTGVGKTTTIAKIASKYKVDYEKKVAFITADTYRIAATEQLQVYANILDAPMSIVYSKEELNEAIEKYAEYDLVFVDTAGFSHKNEEQKEDIRNLIQGVSPEYTSEVYLVLSATTKYRDLLDIVDTYRTISEFKLIFTKLDETSTYGNLLNIKLYSDAELSYTTNGQNVPDDIELFDTQKIVKQLLGGNS